MGDLTSETLRGKVVVLDFWATWCGPCRASMSTLARLDRQLRSKGLTIVGATWNDTGDAQAFLKDNQIEYAHGAGDKFAAAYGIDQTGIRTMFVIGRDGRVVESFIGWNGDVTEQRLSRAIRKALARPQ